MTLETLASLRDDEIVGLLIRARLFSMPPVSRPRARLRVFMTANTVPA
ncbi:MAG: hypothetical protein WA624_15900 [Methylocella sp.]